jgi:aspartyl-tRNA(Asn)/glutamyl-tRNA(Gln) amidotransferase subunit A
MDDLTELSVIAASDLLRTRKLSPVEYLSAFLARIDRYDGALNAFISVDREGAMAAARAAECEIAQGQWRGVLHGIPVALKDIFDVEGQRTSVHSRVRMDHIAAQDGFVVRRLREAGAVFIGKTALHEFATGGPSFDLPWPPARNPWNRRCHPGGSSSGSGVAVAAGFAPVALGTDTGGSVRNPATACGIAGVKPTYGAVSRAGAFPLSFSLDHVGVLTRANTDNAIVLEALVAHDPNDPSSVPHPAPDLHADLTKGVKGLRLGILEEFGAAASAEIRAAFDASLRVFESLGAELVPLKLPPLDSYVGCGRLILQAEGYAVHEHWLKTRITDYGQRGRTRLLPGAFLTAADYLRAQQMRAHLCRAFADAIARVDAALCVSSLELPCAIDDEIEIDRTYDRQARTPFNLTGTPALSIPMGFSQNGLPMGLQVVSAAFAEPIMYRVAQAYEDATDWHLRRPDLNAALAAAQTRHPSNQPEGSQPANAAP